MSLLVKQAGMLSLIQDEGRFGQHHIGLTHGGAIDNLAFHWANRLCSNDLSATALEISIGGVVLEAQVATQIALTGAEMSLTINEQARELWRTHTVNVGDIISIGYAQAGCRCYLAVKGGLQIPLSFGSAATVCRENVGGLQGNKLQQGDVLACHSYKATINHALAKKYQPSYGNNVCLRAIPSYQQQHFSSLQQRLFYSCEYAVSEHYDRMGYRLAGQRIKADIHGILSEGICLGAIQVPADGQPIVLLNDRQTIGGYPKIATAISLDTAKLGQLTQGGKVHFEAISMDKAHNVQCLAKSIFESTPLQVCA